MATRGRPKAELVLTDEERETLERWARRPTSAQALALRCRIVLACAEGLSNQQVAAAQGVNQVTVGKWRARFAAVAHRRRPMPAGDRADENEALLVHGAGGDA